MGLLEKMLQTVRKPGHRGRPGAGACATLVCAVSAAVALTPMIGCSLALDTRPAQCGRDQDCARFAGSVCDSLTRICVPVVSIHGSGGGPGITSTGGAVGSGNSNTGGVGGFAGAGGPLCRVASGCMPCAPAQQAKFFNSCTDATCIPFDNRSRLSNLAADGGLKPLP